MKTIGYVDRGLRGGLMISEEREKRWNNQPVVMREDAERTITAAVAAERERIAAIWDVKAKNALECMKSSGKDGRHFQQIYKDRLEIAAAIRSAVK